MIFFADMAKNRGNRQKTAVPGLYRACTTLFSTGLRPVPLKTSSKDNAS